MVTLDCTVESDRSPWLCCTVQLTDRSPWLRCTVQWVWTGCRGYGVLYSVCGLVAMVTVYCTVGVDWSPWLRCTVQWVWTGRCGNVVLYSGCGLVAVVTVYCTVMDGDSPVSSMRY